MKNTDKLFIGVELVTILILVDGFLQYLEAGDVLFVCEVTILILVDGFLQLDQDWYISKIKDGHNPYFSRWFSAMTKL